MVGKPLASQSLVHAYFFDISSRTKVIAGHIIDNWHKYLFVKNGSPSIHMAGINSFTKIRFDIISMLVNFV
jgi:hypothetical protein